MNDIDLEMLLGIADGTLTGDAREQALARIAASPDLGEELAAQLAAMDGLASLTPATMTESERSTLRSNLIEQLHLESAAAPAPAPAKKRLPWWQPVLGLASAAALLLAIVVIPSMLGSSADEGSSDVVALTTESVARSNQDAAATAEDAPAGGSSTPATIVVPQVAESDVQEFFDSPPPIGGDTATTVTEDTFTDEGQADSTEDEADPTSVEAAPLLSVLPDVVIDAAVLDACMSTLGDELPAGEYAPQAATLVDGVPIVHFGIETADGIAYSVSVSLDTCTLTVVSP